MTSPIAGTVSPDGGGGVGLLSLAIVVEGPMLTLLRRGGVPKGQPYNEQVHVAALCDTKGQVILSLGIVEWN